MITGIVQFFYPGIKKDDIKKVSLLGLTFFFIVGSYWLLRLLKDLFFYERLGFPVDLGYMPNHGRDLIPFAISPISYLCLVELSRNEKKNINVFGKKYTI